MTTWLSPIPDELPDTAETPCLVIDHAAVRHNLERTVAACGGAERLIPHVKTHRAPWLTQDLISQGIRAFKVATPAEVEMAAGAGASEVLWGYPSANEAAIHRVLAAARAHPQTRFLALVGAPVGADLWLDALSAAGTKPVGLLIDLESGMGRTGMALDSDAAEVAHRLVAGGVFAGWHVYDGHNHDTDQAERARAVADLAERVLAFAGTVEPDAATTGIVAGNTYTFDLWPKARGLRVSPGGWIYSSARHQRDLPEFGWRTAAFVVSTVVAARGGTITIDAGSKAVGSDLPTGERFAWPGRVIRINEEHAVLENDALAVGDRVALIPGHACTTAYLYDRAWVHGLDGTWSVRDQLGARR